VKQGNHYEEASRNFGAALERLARGYEADADKRRDLLQEIHLELWRSFKNFDSRCSLRTWVYRVASNTGATYVVRQRRLKLNHLADLEEIENAADHYDHAAGAEQNLVLEKLLQLIHRLKPIDRQVMLLYLEDMDSASIGEITGISPGHVKTKIHRIKTILRRRFHGGKHDDE
jgi:RNA polymerase sigma-70 factor (ECF subfamily)